MTVAQRVAWALTITGIVLTVTTIALGAWVSGYSRGYNRKGWHRPLVALIGTLAAAAFIAAAWLAALSGGLDS